MYFRTRLALPVALLVALAGCGHAASPSGSPSGPRHTVTDMAGRKVTLPAHIARVGTNYPAVNEILFLLGGMDKLVANDQGEATASHLFTDMYPRLKKIPEPFTAASPDVNVESLLRTHPDVVFLTPGNPLIAKMRSIGVPVVVLSVFNDPKQLEAGVRLVADVLGGDAPARAQRFARYYDGNVKRAADGTAKVAPADRPKVYYTANGPYSTEGKGSIVTTWITEGGGRNIAADNGVSAPPTFTTVTMEKILSWNPDYIVCRDPSARRQILGDPRWRTVAAVRNKRVYANPLGVFVWSVRSGESALQPLWAAKTLHPGLFPHLDMRAEVRNFYRTFYSYTPTDRQITDILDPRTV